MKAKPDTFNVDKNNEVLARLKVEYVDIEDVQPNDYNPNRQSDHDFELLCRSISSDGFTQPVVVTSDLTVIDGEHRWRACKALGYKKIAVVRTKMNAAQARIATLRHNRARGSEDVGQASTVLRELAEMGQIEYAQEELGLGDIEVQRLMKDMEVEFASLASFEVTDAELGAIGEGLTDQDKADNIDTTADIRRAQEKKLAAARVQEESALRAGDGVPYRLLAVFTGEEAEVVKTILGTNKAATVLELCHEASLL